MTSAKSRLLTIPELAERLRISKRSAYRVVKEMRHAVIAGRVVVPESAVEKYIEARMREPVALTTRERRVEYVGTTDLRAAECSDLLHHPTNPPQPYRPGPQCESPLGRR